MNYNIILIRHGESTYNYQNKFTGWKNVDLTPKGIQEANQCSDLLKDIHIDICYTSKLLRAQKTLSIILNNLNQSPNIIFSKMLNERDYGDLVGKNKADTALKYGSKQVELWRRSYDIPPPNGESLEMTCTYNVNPKIFWLDQCICYTNLLDIILELANQYLSLSVSMLL